MGQGFANTFGKNDPNATNDMLNGQVVATGTPGAQTVRDPNGGLTDAQMRNRRLLQGGKGFLSIMGQNQRDQSAGQPTNFSFANNQPQFTPPTYTPPVFTGGPTGPFQGNDDNAMSPPNPFYRMRRSMYGSQDEAPFFGRY